MKKHIICANLARISDRLELNENTLVVTSPASKQLIAVKSICLHRVRVPLVEPFRISNGSVAEKDSILIELLTDDGHVGWGEASPMSGSFYSPDTPDSVWENLTT